jgi:hypothetical protein
MKGSSGSGLVMTTRLLTTGAFRDRDNFVPCGLILPHCEGKKHRKRSETMTFDSNYHEISIILTQLGAESVVAA